MEETTRLLQSMMKEDTPPHIVQTHPHTFTQEELKELYEESNVLPHRYDEVPSPEQIIEDFETTVVENEEWHIFDSLITDHTYIWNKHRGYGIVFTEHRQWQKLKKLLDL